MRAAAREVTGAEDVNRLTQAVEDLQRTTEAGLAAVTERLDRVVELLEAIRPGR
jgi:hypothetical protein